ncbi:hypothetical protein [Pantanalinema sp. GBBB05]|uniref:hypothetical protein n=1 Tax=Pantanalinema sp. GBBB05 TaxID=2604139 RepID=UPI003D81995A
MAKFPFKAAAISAVLTTGAAIGTVLGSPPSAIAQSCNYYAGRAVGGQSINVDLCSISRASARSVDFVYYLDNERIYSQANCQTSTWTTFPERQTHRPQSQATQNMLNVVCRSQGGNPSDTRVATVFDPPSNIRSSPNGSVLCRINTPTSIYIYGSIGDWYYTDACGEMGVIHSTQIRF